MEVIIVMGIAAILAGFAYSAYTIISRSYLSFTSKNNNMGAVVLLDKLLKKDFNRAVRVTGGNHQLWFQLDSGVIEYEFQPALVIRRQGMADTLRVQTAAFRTSFEQQARDSTMTDSLELTDELELTLLLQKEKIPYHYHKTYSSANLFKSYPNAIH
jgi:Tfp pilus assembly protein FimT